LCASFDKLITPDTFGSEENQQAPHLLPLNEQAGKDCAQSDLLATELIGLTLIATKTLPLDTTERQNGKSRG
jgi:hypothetical protein